MVCGGDGVVVCGVCVWGGGGGGVRARVCVTRGGCTKIVRNQLKGACESERYLQRTS
jgi:hypothetical protein